MIALTLVCLIGFHAQKSKMRSLENKITKNYCQNRKTPYNAPPLTDDVLRHAATAAEKGENNRLTPEAKSVRYAASQPGRDVRLPTLFN
ncbi:hypothetical protein, partial [Xenorhabdus eapokensis]|uniref:hypothetical protein n=1 Tax=Xenorhabdus eapokensis TaxID=1873482 RepID=UPI001ABF979F